MGKVNRYYYFNRNDKHYRIDMETKEDMKSRLFQYLFLIMCLGIVLIVSYMVYLFN